MLGFIVNPSSGNGRGRITWSTVERMLTEQQIEYEVFFTEVSGHATALAQRMVRQLGFRAVVVVGGDGTVNETAAGLLGTDIPLGVIAAGSGNDFTRGMGIPEEASTALQTVLTGKCTKMDIGRIGDRIFVNSYGTGFDGEVAKANNTSVWKRWMNRVRLGKVSYAVTVVRLLNSYVPARVTLSVNDQLYTFDRVWMVVAANTPYYGGGMNICPNALPNDGQFEICIVHGLSRLKLLRYFPLIYQGAHVSLPYVTMLRGDRLYVHSDRSLVAHVDGEWTEPNGAEAVLQRHALQVLVPSS